MQPKRTIWQFARPTAGVGSNSDSQRTEAIQDNKDAGQGHSQSQVQGQEEVVSRTYPNLKAPTPSKHHLHDRQVYHRLFP